MRKPVFLIILLILSCSKENNKMDYKTFVSPQGWFSLQLPPNWDQYEDEEGTYAFFDTIRWTGNFRLTPLKWEAHTDSNKTADFLQGELNDNQNSVKSKIGSFDCVSYKKYTIQDNEEFVMYYWTLGNNDILFISSFCIDKRKEKTKENKEALEKINAILQSIKIK
jgi:hypothetical protein